MPNPFVHVELHSTDVEKSKAFYTGLFNWKLTPLTDEYSIIEVGEGTGGGMMTRTIPGAPSCWTAYVIVEDIRASTEKAREMAANIIVDVTEVPDMGWFSIFIDPTGARLGLWQAKGM